MGLGRWVIRMTVGAPPRDPPEPDKADWHRRANGSRSCLDLQGFSLVGLSTARLVLFRSRLEDSYVEAHQRVGTGAIDKVHVLWQLTVYGGLLRHFS